MNCTIQFVYLSSMIVRFLLSGLAVLLASYLLPGVRVEHYGYALLVAALLSIVNVVVKPLLILFTIPLTILTLGLFLLVINAIMILLVSALVPKFQVDGFWWALAFSLILSVFNSIFSEWVDEKRS
jgi:putative membrane protein